MIIQNIHQWEEITEEEYKSLNPIIGNTLSETLQNILFHNDNNIITKRDIIIPESISGILNISDYLSSNEPKKYKYYKSNKFQKQLIYTVGSLEYDYIKSNENHPLHSILINQEQSSNTNSHPL